MSSHGQYDLGFRRDSHKRKRRQNWQIGEIVTVGFVQNLQVINKIDGEYRLAGRNGLLYAFVPHRGLYRI